MLQIAVNSAERLRAATVDRPLNDEQGRRGHAMAGADGILDDGLCVNATDAGRDIPGGVGVPGTGENAVL